MSKSDDIRKSFIVDESDFSKDFAEKLAEKVMKYAQVSKKGELLVKAIGLSPDNKLKLFLSARFIAHRFDKNIPETIGLSDAASLLTNESREAIGSRMSQLVKSHHFAKKKGRGVYVVQPYKIEEFIESLNFEEKEDPKKHLTKGRRQRKVVLTKSTGVGKDILELIDSKFFNTPRTVREVEDKLKEEVKYHDKRVIDKTIRQTYVKSKRLLKRIKNPEGGRTKWLYVVRK